MKHIVQFSGGVGSAYCAYMVKQQYGTKDMILLFHDVPGGQHPDTYVFNQEVSRYLGVPITEISLDKTIWEVIKENNVFPSMFIPFCNRIFKVEMEKKFHETLDDEYIRYNGYDATEHRRVKNAKDKGYKFVSPLYDAGITSYQAKRIISHEWGIKLPEPYKYLQHNNCIPCFKGGKKHFRQVAIHYPDQFKKAMEMEKYFGHTVFKDCTLQDVWNQAQAMEKQMSLFDIASVVNT